MLIFILFAICYAPFIFSNIVLENTLLDLESKAQDFVLSTKKIEVPGYPLAFNPAIIRWQNHILMSFRIIPDLTQKFTTEVGIVMLNEDFEPITEAQLLNLRDETAIAPCRAEDIRFQIVGERLFIIYDDNEEPKISKGGFRVYVAELFFNGDHFCVGDIECLRTFEGESRDVREKAWVPFEYENHLLLAYSLVPHKIFCPRLDGSGICDTVVTTISNIQWDFGILRGGTQSCPHNQEQLAFFHSSKNMQTANSQGQNMLHYFIGAYTFSSEPPFQITAISREPIIGKQFYNGIIYEPYWKPVRCVFPCGYIMDDQFIWIAYGRDDHECWIAQLDKQKLLTSLEPVIEIAP